MDSDQLAVFARKRRRLTHACERCRSRKVRCDELEPDCSNCVRAGLRCHTFDPRQPHVAVQRREARGTSAKSPSQPQSAGSTPQSIQLGDTGNGAPIYRTTSRPTPQESGLDGPQQSQLLPMLPRFIDGNSLFMLMQWLDLAFARLGVKQNLSSRYGNMQRRRTRDTQRHRLASHTDAFPPAILDEQTALWFNATIGEIFPVCDAVSMSRDEEMLSDVDDRGNDMRRLVSVLIVACATAKDQPDSAPKLATRCFDYALSRLADIVGEGQSIHSLQALFLIILLLRWQNEVEMSWHLLSLAVSLLHRQGLHKNARAIKSSSASGTQSVDKSTPVPLGAASAHGDAILRMNVFWSIFIIDKVLALELERQPLLRGAECDQATPGGQSGTFLAILRLSQLQDQLLDRLKLSRNAEEAATTHIELQQRVKEKMGTVGDLDQQLQTWVDSLPQEQKPSEYQYADGGSLTGTSFLAAQYHQTLFLIHRHALVHNTNYIRAQVDEFFPDKPYRNRLRNGQTVCANAARSLLSIIDHLSTIGSHSLLINTYTPMLAICALTIYIIRRQSPPLAKADLELQSAAIALVAKQTLERYNHEEHPEAQQGGDDLISLLKTLHDFTASYIHRSQPQSPRRPATNTSETTIATQTPAASASAVTATPGGLFSGPLTVQPHGNAFSPALGDMNTDGALPTDSTQWPLLSQLNTDMDMLWGPNAMDLDWDSLALAYDLPSG